MKRVIIFFLLVILAMSGCLTTKIGQNEKRSGTTEVQFDENTIALFYVDKEKKIFFENSRPQEITSKDINDIETILKKCIAEYNSEHKEYDRIDLKEYIRQYSPVINKKGRIVAISFFCQTDDHLDWKNERLAVDDIDDGGKCYFNLEIDLKKQECFNFFVNGEA